MKVQRTFARAVPVLLAASFAMTAVAAFAQRTPAPGQPQTPQGEARDLLGRAQSARDGQMVEDLIRRLQGPEGPAAPGVSPPAATAPVPTAPGSSATPQVAKPPPAATPVTPPPTARAPATPSTAPSATPQPSTPSTAARPAEPSTPTVPSQRRLPRPAAPPVAAPVTSPAPTPAPTATTPVRPSVPLQAPLPTRSPNNIAPPSSAAAPPAAEPPAVGPAQQRLPQPPRRAATPPTIAPPPGAGATPPAPSQLPITPAQVERMDALPNIDVEVLFYLDSARLTNRTFATLAILGRALADERLAKQVFLIAGHTDATGPPDYNLALSERRAQAVRDFLIENFGIEPDRLLARGFGPERLKNPHSPGSRVNRRVQVVNWTSEADPSAASPPPPRR